MSRKPQLKLKKCPPYVSTSTILALTNKYDLLELEKKYDRFLQQNQHLLLIHELIDEYLDIRDTISIQRQRIERKEKNQLFLEKSKIIESHNYSCLYNHSYQIMLPDSLKLESQQIDDGYMPCPNEPREYKCGCLSMKYYSPCCCKKISTSCRNPRCKEKTCPIIKLQYYCIDHMLLIAKQENLENEITKVKKEISYIKHNSNSLDYDDYKNAISKNPKPKRISRYPWKNI